MEGVGSESSLWVSKKVPRTKRFQALAWKESVTLIRHYWFVFGIICLPLLESLIYCLAIGSNPKDLHISIYNQETTCLSGGMFARNTYSGQNGTFACRTPPSLSCRIIGGLQEMGLMTAQSESEISAEDEVRKGRAWAAITFPRNFTSALMERAGYTISNADSKVIVMGVIRVSLDQSDQIISLFIQDHLFKVLKQVLAEADDTCHDLKHMKDLPLKFNSPVYGDHSLTFLNNIAPGLIASIVMMFPLTATLSSLLPDKIRGTLERGLITGVTMSEVILSQFVVNLAPSIIITAVAVVIPYGFFQLTMIGSYWTLFIILLFVVVTGMLLGFILALISRTLFAASLVAIGFFFTSLVGSGTVWPVQGANRYFQFICWILPMTYPTEALRNVAHRGWGLRDRSSLQSMTLSTIWILAFLACLITILRNR